MMTEEEDCTILEVDWSGRDSSSWVLVGPYPPCTQTSAAATRIFEGGWAIRPEAEYVGHQS
jgi:hypothetical protein